MNKRKKRKNFVIIGSLVFLVIVIMLTLIDPQLIRNNVQNIDLYVSIGGLVVSIFGIIAIFAAVDSLEVDKNSFKFNVMISCITRYQTLAPDLRKFVVSMSTYATKKFFTSKKNSSPTKSSMSG